MPLLPRSGKTLTVIFRSRSSPITSTSSGFTRRTGVRARTARRAWTDRPRRSTRRNLEGNLQSLLEPREVGHVPRAARAAGPHPEGERGRNTAHRHPDLRGQGPATRGRDGVGGRLRAGLSGLLVRLPARVAPRIKRCNAVWVSMTNGGRLGPRGRRAEVLRHDGPRAHEGDSSAAGCSTECCCGSSASG